MFAAPLCSRLYIIYNNIKKKQQLFYKNTKILNFICRHFCSVVHKKKAWFFRLCWKSVLVLSELPSPKGKGFSVDATYACKQSWANSVIPTVFIPTSRCSFWFLVLDNCYQKKLQKNESPAIFRYDTKPFCTSLPYVYGTQCASGDIEISRNIQFVTK